MYRKLALLIVAGVLLTAIPATGADLPGDVKASLEKAGLKIYPGAVFCTGKVKTGVRFATSDSPEKVRAWYREQYPGWSVQDKYGTWSFYDGPPDQGPGVYLSTRNMLVQHNADLPGWHSLAADMTTEILITSP